MLRFDFTLKYVASKSMEQAESLSRRVDWIEKVERDNENQVILKKKIEKSETNFFLFYYM